MTSGRLPLRTLQAFEATSRHLSVSKAAQELGVTQSAVSHQLHRLSEAIGEKLVVKIGRNVGLTEAGRRLALSLSAAFSQINRSVAETIGVQRPVVRLAVCSSFAPGWLIGRLRDFYDAHPDVDLQLRMYARDPNLMDDVADAFVTTLPSEKGFWSMKLRAELLIPVGVPAFAGDMRKRKPLVTTTLDPARLGGDWRAYCETAGLSLDRLRAGPWRQVTHYCLALEMARRGLGVALVPEFLAEEDIAAGLLTQLWTAQLPTHEDYYLCVKAIRRREAPLRALIGWFKRQKAKSSA